MRKNAFKIIILASVVIAGCAKEVEPPNFSGEQAYKLLVAQCDFGPRPPGSAVHDSFMVWLKNFLDTLADSTEIQYFSAVGYDGKILRMGNIIARFNPGAKEKIMFCAHWDTRPWADRDPDTTNHKKPILGANDGASGVAVLLHLAQLMHSKKPPIGVDIVLFDGEDYGHEGDLDMYLLGSKYYAQNLLGNKPKFVILLDMIGDSDLNIPKEQFSAIRFAPELVETLWNRAKKLSLKAFADTLGPAVIDDHHPLASAGIKAIDIIDFDYKYWHTQMDTPDKCSPKSLEQVGKLLVDIVYNPPEIK